MNVVRSQAQPELIYVLLTEQDAKDVIAALKKPRNKVAKRLRGALRSVCHA